MADTDAPVHIKGLRDGLLITLSGPSWDESVEALFAQIDDRPAFFSGARVALDIGAQVLHVAELVPLRDRLSERGIALWAVISESPTTETTAQLLGLATRISKPQPTSYEQPVEIDDQTALWIGKTVRSGTRIEFPGHVVVLGDVNPGAEIVAGGSVVIWGRLRGVVHAGADGDKGAVVCALELSPTQLRIADEIAVLADDRDNTRPATVSLKDEHLVAEPWQPGQSS